MKKILISSALFLLSATCLYSQTDTTAKADTVWRSGGISGLNLNQISFSNWASGGDNALSGSALLSLYAKYKKDRWAWDNTADFAIGGNKQDQEDIKKTDDKIDLNSKIGYDMIKKFYISYILGFKSQFTEGFLYTDTSRERISNFLAPGYLLNSLGIDWKPNDKLSLYISPLTIKTTFCEDDVLSAEGQYGVEPGQRIRTETGAYFVTQYTHNVMKNVALNTKLELFSNYSENPQNIDVNWDVLLSFKVNNYINAIIQTSLIYDDDIIISDSDGIPLEGPRTQFKESFGIGFAYKFDKARVE
jgi:hypothetical protein